MMKLPAARALLFFAWAAAAPGCSDKATAPDVAIPADLGVQDSSPLAPDQAPADTSPQTCDPLSPRAEAPELLIGPAGLDEALLAKIDSARSELLLMMYQLTLTKFVNALIEVHARGVAMRIILDSDQQGNEDAIAALQAAGVTVRRSPARFNYYHVKVFLVDNEEVLVMSGNLNSYTMNSERNYRVVLRDAQDIAQIREIFEQDWADSADPALPCTRLLVSPVNAAAKMLGFIEGATKSLDLAVMYLSDSGLRDAVKARAAAGVAVRVLLAHPAWIDGNAETAAELTAEQIPVKYLASPELHAKLVVADGLPYVGSINLSNNSLNNNREVGVVVTDQTAAETAAAQFEQDWQAGIAP